MAMRKPGVFVRFHARLRDDERGFGLLETVIAITVIFVSLTALAYTATAGFRYIALARERQSGNGIANQIMEEVRGLAFDKVTKGLLDTDLTGDPNIVNCAAVYYFQSCTGEKIINTSGLAPTTPVVPHRGTFPGYPTSFDYSVYVTQQDNISTNPYRVTVIVTWGGGAIAGATKSIQSQSLFYSPQGCVSSSTHPFAAPCQPFFFGSAQPFQGQVEISGSVWDLDWSDMTLVQPGPESDAQHEQVSQVQGNVAFSKLTMATSAGTDSQGGESTTSSADGDPSGVTPNYSNPAVDALVKKWTLSLDQAGRLAGAREAQKLVVDDAPHAYLHGANWNVVTRKNVHGYRYYNDELNRYAYMYKS